MNRRRILIPIAAFALAPMLCSQTGSDAAIIHAEAREVVVDVTVAGNNRSARELTATDFTIFEDGKPQKLTSVSRASADPETSQKHFVIYFDFTTESTADQAASRKYAVDFVDGLAAPDRFMSVAAMTDAGARVIRNFTTSRSALKQAVAIPMNAKPVSIQIAGPASLALADSLEAVAASIAPAPGRKALLLFTGGYANSDSSTAKALIAACNRANVAIYAITPDLRLPPSLGPPQRGVVIRDLDQNPALTFAQTLSEGTGGQAFTLSAELPNQLGAIAREQDDYYRVAYTPPPAKEGSCHTLRVATNIRGLETRARKEYCTEKVVDIVAGKIAGQTLDSRTATNALAATFQTPYFYTGTNRASVHISLEVVPSGMRFQKDKNGMHGEINLAGTALRSGGETAARFVDTVNIDLENQQRADAFTHTPYHYEHQLTVPAGTYAFQMTAAVSPDAAQRLELPLEIPAWNSASFGIGGIAWSTEARPVASTISAAPVLEGHAPLVAGGKEFVPAATNRFHRSEPVFFYTEVYDPALDSGKPTSPLLMQYRVIERVTGAVKLDTGMLGASGYVNEGDPVVPFATRVPVAQLQPGSYLLEVRAGHSSGTDTVTRTAGFDLD